MSGRVRIGTCSDTIDVAFIRSAFDARGISVSIAAEHHATLLGPLYGAFLSLDIWVDEADAEEAVALLQDLREGPATATDATDTTAGTADDGSAAAPDHSSPADGEGDGDRVWLARTDAGGARAHDHDEAATDLAEAPVAELRARFYQRRRSIVAILSGIFVTFGTAHLWTGAWMRGIALAALEIVGIRQADAGHAIGKIAILGAVVLDVCGTIVRMSSQRRADARADAQSKLPRARAHDA